MNSSNFFAELLARIFSANPKFFKYIQYAALAVGCLSGCITVVQDHIEHLPSWVNWLDDKTIQFSAGIAWLMAQLPKQDPNNVTNSSADAGTNTQPVKNNP